MAVFMFFTVTDGKQPKPGTSTIRIPFPDATPIGTLITGVTAVGALINPLVTGGLKSAGVAVEVDISGTWGPVAALLSDVQEKMEWGIRAANGFLKRINLPTIDEDMFVPGSAIGDITDAAMGAFKDFLEDGIDVGGTVIQPSDVHGSDLENVEYYRENWGKRRL
jgi:hypothetical protein